VMFTYYNDEGGADEDIKIEIIDPNNESVSELEYYLLDENNDNELFKKETYASKKHSSIITLKMYSTVLIKIKNSENRF
ncbi:MAG: hypothetical protein J5852_07310, partial [Clostridia bacterium]|nr:hypothetical protein [Clostridia bacterium]